MYGSMNMPRTAVDSGASTYWTDYFGDYGRQWVRDIPKKVKACIDRQGGRTASAEFPVRPLAKVVTKQGVLLEGAVRTPERDFLFRAQFDHAGRVVSFDAI